MNAQTLERLLLDRALGALTADTATLLDAYLAEHPAAAADAAGFDETVRFAEQVLPAGPLRQPPAFPAGRLTSASRRLRRTAFLWRATGLAACLLAGVGIGVLLRTARPDAAASPVEWVVQNEPPQDMPQSAQDEFWSARRLYERAAGARPARPPRLIWPSPLSAPKIGDST